MKLKDYDVQIFSEDEAIPEYQIESDPEARTISCFIPSCSGKTFEIRWKSFIADHTYVASVIDGRGMGKRPTKPLNECHRKGVRSNPDQIMPFVFSDLVLQDDETLQVDSSILQSLGTIEITVTRVYRHDQHDTRKRNYCLPKSIGPIHEKHKKVGGHYVSFGKAIESKKKQSLSKPKYTQYPDEGHWAKFIFRYRPKALLQAQGIVPPPVVPDTRQSVSKTTATVRALKRSRSAEAEMNDFVQGSSNNPLQGSRAAKRLKAEPQSDDQVIDLTMIAGEPPKLLDPSLRGAVIDLTLDGLD